MDENVDSKRLSEIKNKENQNEEILDCVKEIEEYIEKVLPE